MGREKEGGEKGGGQEALRGREGCQGGEKEEKKEEKKKEEKKDEKKKEEKKEAKKEVEEATVLTEPAKKGDTFIYVETKIGMPGDKIMVDGEMNTIAPDAKEAKEPP